jgi:hypothetical protein
MPYAIFSKRTRIISRIVDDLNSLLPSESMIEVDEEVNYPREHSAIVQGQEVNTYGFPLFERGNTPTTQFSYVDYDPVTGRPYTVKNEPRFIQPTIPGGDPVTRRIDIPIVSNPFAWRAEELYAVKYESLLSQNFPYDVLIGEEFMNATHIDAGSSSDYVLTEGRCVIAPGGVVVTASFSFNITKNIGITGATTDEASQYMFDTYYLDTEPDINQGIEVYWRGVRYSDSGTTLWQPALTNTEMPTTEVENGGAGESTATHLKSIQLRFTNLTGGLFSLENYLLFLRLRKTTITV